MTGSWICNRCSGSLSNRLIYSVSPHLKCSWPYNSHLPDSNLLAVSMQEFGKIFFRIFNSSQKRSSICYTISVDIPFLRIWVQLTLQFASALAVSEQENGELVFAPVLSDTVQWYWWAWSNLKTWFLLPYWVLKMDKKNLRKGNFVSPMLRHIPSFCSPDILKWWPVNQSLKQLCSWIACISYILGLYDVVFLVLFWYI